MNERIAVFVNERPVELREGADVAEAVQAADRTLSEKVAGGQAYVTDGRGIEIDAGVPVSGGSILRVIIRARRASTEC
jgi:hypothetical protein